MQHHLSIDLETYCSVPIGKSGSWKYVQGQDFEILLFAYSLDGGPVTVIDCASGEEIPAWLISALRDPAYIKHAYNASFEYGALQRVFGGMVPSQWRCTMFHGLYCGYTAGLDATGKALGLPQDKQKLSTGKNLIRYFCIPCRPSKVNGQRTRNYPQHDPEKWRLFKEYNAQDVITEMEIEKRLSLCPVPEWVQHQWEVDLTINERGVSVDENLVAGALYCGAVTKERLMGEATQITQLRNPNSVKQVLEWLNETMETDEETAVTDLRKDTVAKMLADNALADDSDVRRMLEIRQELSKTSTKKYDAIEQCVCRDSKVRGLLQFYGANRTGAGLAVWCRCKTFLAHTQRTLNWPVIWLSGKIRRPCVSSMVLCLILYRSLSARPLWPLPDTCCLTRIFPQSKPALFPGWLGKNGGLKRSGRIRIFTAKARHRCSACPWSSMGSTANCGPRERSLNWPLVIRAARGRLSTWALWIWAYRKMNCRKL